MIGVLGGMGPLATVDFFNKVLAATPAQGDQDHVPLLIQSDPRIAPRVAAILYGGRSPAPELLAGRDRLIAAGATALAMPCNTAHYWYEELSREGGLPILHMADAACDALGNAKRAGLLATEGTVAAGFYQSRLTARGIECLLSSRDQQRTLVLPAIEHVKRNELVQAHELVHQAARRLLDNGAQVIVMGCTEIPLAMAYQASDVSLHCVDATRALARTCVRWWQTA